MPAYRDHVNAQELEDLVAFVQAVAEPALPSDPHVLEGRRVAEANGCFACHGADGRAAIPNPGSFKGVIPAWNSADYPKLVKDQDELREWIRDGVIQRFERNPLATYFLDRQAISMPAYGELLSESELDSLVAYVEWCSEPDEGATPFRRRPAPAVEPVDVVARGEGLYRSTGCAACHGPGGRGGVPNALAPGGFVPALDLIAERLQLFEEEEIEVVLDGLASGATFESMAQAPPLEFFDEVLEAYRDVRSVILEGRLTPGASPGDEPAMRMPAWSERTGGAPGPHSDADIDAIVAYLLAQY
jgi:mono/diheme cytochrome c family protein